MADQFFLEVVTPQKAVVSEDIRSISAPGSEGEFCALKGHTTFLTSLKIGTIRYEDAAGNECLLFANGGFAEVLPDKVTILAESAERSEDINLSRAKEALARAERRLSDKAADTDIVRAEAALRRAVSRIKMAEVR
ncbi:F0F1 ATP synthase subunit epsilon [Desulfobacter hydrogenophilus]|uniref:ATP synthase epsilon chain n=1 Tax=Desulfobacter hydrogenophilus TaxID=2291 RepID=A0A328FE70_9BACT|nr:F0F1 ATP synthase subunit epsilon [Desulfobacter hydrogenophilus]NDY71570.1 F0F1 ATP synthase subunit epsilon [Desulfobacter hydrogenophilus]QBH15347.1 F0F1 ATP synthase subunit epsilon [Desulfobacter hydrogenophilus]RAM02426.1 F0F1 ATP synthase subunit epsilon [Desulfobacter hydrogenophilus]